MLVWGFLSHFPWLINEELLKQFNLSRDVTVSLYCSRLIRGEVLKLFNLFRVVKQICQHSFYICVYHSQTRRVLEIDCSALFAQGKKKSICFIFYRRHKLICKMNAFQIELFSSFTVQIMAWHSAI